MSLLTRASIVSSATLGSRVLGFVRDAATAAVLGVGPVADALVASLSLPLLARRLLAEGAFNLAFIPALVGQEEKGEAQAPRALAVATLVLLVGVLLGAATLGALFMPQLIGVLAPGFSPDGQRADVAILCGRIAVFYLPLAGISAIFGGIANGARRVLLPALAPMVANLTVLAVIAMLIVEGDMESDAAAFAIAAATVAAGVSQAVLMVIEARRCSATPGLRVTLRAVLRQAGALPWAAARKVLRAALPALLFAGMSQFRLIIVTALVSGTDGAVAALNYAQRLMDLPLGLVGASAGAVLLPALLRREAGEENAGARAVLAALAFALPAAMGLAVLAHPIVVTLFQRGSFDAEDARITATLLSVLALSLPAQGLERVLIASAAAGGLMRQAEKIALASLALCLVAGAGLGFAFGARLGPAIIASAVALSAFFSIAALMIGLARTGALAFDRRFSWICAGLVGATALMGAGVAGLDAAWSGPSANTLAGVARLGALIAAGVLIYGAAALGLKRLARLTGA